MSLSKAAEFRIWSQVSDVDLRKRCDSWVLTLLLRFLDLLIDMWPYDGEVAPASIVTLFSLRLIALWFCKVTLPLELIDLISPFPPVLLWPALLFKSSWSLEWLVWLEPLVKLLRTFVLDCLTLLLLKCPESTRFTGTMSFRIEAPLFKFFCLVTKFP